MASTGAPTTGIPTTEGLDTLHRGDWRSPRNADNPIKTLHEFLANNGYLDRNVEGFGTNYGSRTAAAIAKAAGALVNDRTNIPAGAPVFFEPTSHNSGYGHIAIYSREKTASGDPIIITTGWRGWDGIHKIPLSELEAKTGAFTGWGLIKPED